MRDMLKAGAVAVGLAVSLSGIAMAGEVAPTDVSFTDDNEIAASLTGKPGDAATGRKIFSNRKLGNCLACHENSDQKDQLFHGNVGPSVDGAADRWSEAQLRAIVVNSKKVFTEDTVMPGFYSLEVGLHPRKDLVGKTILTAEQVEDVVAYLATLKE